MFLSHFTTYVFKHLKFIFAIPLDSRKGYKGSFWKLQVPVTETNHVHWMGPQIIGIVCTLVTLESSRARTTAWPIDCRSDHDPWSKVRRSAQTTCIYRRCWRMAHHPIHSPLTMVLGSYFKGSLVYFYYSNYIRGHFAYLQDPFISVLGPPN